MWFGAYRGYTQTQSPSGNTDYSNLVTVSGADKGALSGFLTRGGWSTGNTLTPSNYQGGAIVGTVTAPGTYNMYLRTCFGETGTRSVNVATFDATNCVAGTHYVAASNTLTVNDGQRGKVLALQITVTSIPTGFGLIGISITGSNAYRPYMWLLLKGTGHVPGAKFFKSSNGVNVNGSIAGNGSQATPWLGFGNAYSTMAGTLNSGTPNVLYWVQNGTNGHMEWGGTPGNNNLGVAVNPFNAPISNPLIVMPDPGNTSPALWDQGIIGGGSGVLFSNAPALYFKGAGSNFWLCGIHFYRGGVVFNSQDVGTWTNVVLLQCEIDNYSQSANSNVHNLRFDSTKFLIAQDCYFHDGGWTTEKGTGPYPYNSSVASGTESCVGAFYSGGATFANCRFARGQNAIMYKQASNTITDTPPEVTHCIASQCASNSTEPGYLIQYPVQIAATQYGLIEYNVYDGSADTVGGYGLILYASGENAGNSNIDICNNITIANVSNGGGGLARFISTTHVRLFNNVSQDGGSVNNEVEVGGTGQLEISDNNLFVRGTHTRILGYGGTETIYTTLVTWQGAPAGTFLQNTGQDAHSTESATTPAYGNVALGNYRFTDTGGIGGLPRGMGIEYVGIMNNFLNSGLPVSS